MGADAGSAPLVRRYRAPVPVDLAITVSPLRRGRGDPTMQHDPDGSWWRAARVPSGPVTWRLAQQDRETVHATAWGPGAQEFVEQLPVFLGVDEDTSDFAPTHPLIAEAHRRFPGLRMVRTGQIFDELAPAILEQKVHGIAAKESWRILLRKFGEPAPGPRPLTISPSAQAWRRVPSWEFHRANVDPKRASTIVGAAQRAESLDRLIRLPNAEAQQRMQSLPGIGVWTAAEVAQRALGDGDAVSVGDFHLAAMVGWTLAGRPFDDAEMVEYLEPLRPHRYRAIRLLLVAGFAHKPKFGPRTEVTDHRHR